MADVKISNLPASTTPLAGTEVLPIVQTGVTKQVSVANLFVGTISLGAAAGAESLRVTPVASAVNYFTIQGNTTGGGPALTAAGFDTNISTNFITKGTGNHVFYTNNGSAPQLVVAHTASAVNYLQATGAATGGSPNISALGSDANIGLTLTTKGTGSLRLFCPTEVFRFASISGTDITNYFTQTGVLTYAAAGASTNISYTFESKGAGNFNVKTGGGTQFLVAHTASAVDYLQVTGHSAGFPSLTAQGASANIAMLYSCKGNGSHFFQTNNFASTQLLVQHTASAVNYLQATGAVTTGAPVISAQGSDTNISIAHVAKGTGFHSFYSSAGNPQFFVLQTASGVNYLTVQNAATGNSPTMRASGADTNVDLALTPQGTGVLKFGTYTAGILAQAGYITIKDAGGTTRNLLVG
jgi:hypothetical protein